MACYVIDRFILEEELMNLGFEKNHISLFYFRYDDTFIITANLRFDPEFTEDRCFEASVGIDGQIGFIRSKNVDNSAIEKVIQNSSVKLNTLLDAYRFEFKKWSFLKNLDNLDDATKFVGDNYFSAPCLYQTYQGITEDCGKCNFCSKTADLYAKWLTEYVWGSEKTANAIGEQIHKAIESLIEEENNGKDM